MPEPAKATAVMLQTRRAAKLALSLRSRPARSRLIRSEPARSANKQFRRSGVCLAALDRVLRRFDLFAPLAANSGDAKANQDQSHRLRYAGELAVAAKVVI